MDTAMSNEKLTSYEGSIFKLNIETAEPQSRKPGKISINRIHAMRVVLCFVGVAALVGVLCFHQGRRGFTRGGEESSRVQAMQSYDIHEVGVKFTSTAQTVTANTSSENADEEDEGPWRGRLPLDVVPDLYDLHIQPFINDDDVQGTTKQPYTFDGNVVIKVRCEVATDQIVLHFEMNYLQLVNVSLIELRHDGDHDLYDSYVLNARYSFLIVNLTEQMKPGGMYNLKLTYVGQIRDDLAGFFRSSYVDDNGKTVRIAYTQMEPVSARSALPCFDEPAMKAVFNVRITHRTNMTALSNGRETGTVDHGDGWSTTSFEATPPMSTYLLAFAIGVFNYTETITTSGTRLRVWARPNAIENTKYALNTASSLLTYFEEYLGSTYQMPKLDMIGVPNFAWGAMENWGLVVFLEKYLLYEENTSTKRDMENILYVTSHEIAHQWFGNLVTMKWWNDIWLNEGFATYLGYLGAAFLHPELDMVEYMTVASTFSVLGYDLIPRSHPIRTAVSTPAEIFGIFDSISYMKGGAILRMLHDIIGDEPFRSGIQLYLNTFQYDNTVSNNLWDALTEADESGGHHNVTHLMDTWILQMGYPVINLSRVNRTTVEARQEPFLAIGKDLDGTSPFGYTWYIVLSYTSNQSRMYANPDSISILDNSSYEFSLGDDVTDDDWYLANIDAYGYFMVTYDVDNWFRIIQQLEDNHEAISVLSRAKLVDDAFRLGMNRQIHISITLSIAKYLRHEFSWAPWKTVLRHFVRFKYTFWGTSIQGKFEAYFRNLTWTQYLQLGYDRAMTRYQRDLTWLQSHETGYDQTGNKTSVDLEKTSDIIVPITCECGNAHCREDALSFFGDFMASFNKSNPSIDSLNIAHRDVLLCTAIRAGTSVEWDYAWSLYTFSNASAKFTLEWMDALTCALHPWQIQRLLEYILENELKGHIDEAILRLGSNPVGRGQAWNFIRQNWDQLTEKFSAFGYTLGRFVKFMNIEAELEELYIFINSHDLGSARDDIVSAADQVKTMLDDSAEVRREVETWLEGYSQTQ